VVRGRGTQSILRARGRWLAWSAGPSTSPLDRRVLPRCLSLLVLLAAVPNMASASEWMTCYGDKHTVEFLIGGLPQGSITGFALYVGGAPQDPKHWRVSLSYVNAKQARLYFSAVARNAGSEPDVSLAVDGESDVPPPSVA